MNKPDTAEQLLAAATDLFVSNGIANVSVQQILERAGRTVPTLYAAYPGGMAGLVAASLQRWSQAHLDRMRAAVQSGQTVPVQERLKGLFAFLAAWFGEPTFRGSYVTDTAAQDAKLAELAARNPRARQAVQEAHATIAAHRQAERDLLKELARLALPPDPEQRVVEQLADQLQVVVTGAVESARLVPRASRPEIADAARAIALALLTQGTAAGHAPASR